MDEMRVVCFKIPLRLLAELDEYARVRRASRSEVIRRAIREYLEDARSKEKVVYRGRGWRIY